MKKMHLTDVKEVFKMMPERFNSDAARELDAVFQFDITGDSGGAWVLLVRDGVCEVREETHENPNVSLSMTGDTWLSILNKELNAVQAFLSGRLKISGDMMLAQKIPDLFSL
jgi:putative sterol carrier protein